MSECASKYNSRAEETIYILATLLQRQTAEADEAFVLVNDQQREIHGLDMDLNTAALELGVALEKIEELQDENAALLAGALEATRLSSELDKADAFVARLADLAADEDWLGIAQAFGLELATESEDGTFIPEHLETEADYESAPVGTVVAYWHKDPDIIEPGFKRTDRGWRYVELGLADYDELSSASVAWKGHPRKVLQWGSR